jgi:hypothetical protein
VRQRKLLGIQSGVTAFTDNCDLFAAVHEDGINRVARHIMRQRHIYLAGFASLGA